MSVLADAAGRYISLTYARRSGSVVLSIPTFEGSFNKRTDVTTSALQHDREPPWVSQLSLRVLFTRAAPVIQFKQISTFPCTKSPLTQLP